MIDHVRHLAHLRSSTAALVLGIADERWTDEDVHAASALPEWTRAHVLTHIARNADGISSTVAGALRGEAVQRYPGGRRQRDADIEAGSVRSAAELVVDVRESAEKLDRVLAAAAEAGAWDARCDDRSVGDYVLARWREVEIHRVDLAGSYGPADWPPAFVTYLLPDVVSRAGERADAELHIGVSATDSLTTDLPESTWTVGEGPACEVIGPDWAIAAWLVGRANLTQNVLNATPDLRPWM